MDESDGDDSDVCIISETDEESMPPISQHEVESSTQPPKIKSEYTSNIKSEQKDGTKIAQNTATQCKPKNGDPRDLLFDDSSSSTDDEIWEDIDFLYWAQTNQIPAKQQPTPAKCQPTSQPTNQTSAKHLFSVSFSSVQNPFC